MHACRSTLEDPTLRAELGQALVLLVLPAALVAIAFAAPFGASPRERLAQEWPARWQWPLLGAALAVIVLAMLAAVATSGLVPAWQRPLLSGLSPAFALHELVLLPLLHQLAFRTWLFAHLQPGLPPAAIALVSVVAATVAAVPADVAAAGSAAALAIACTALYLRTRRLLAPVLLHALAIALQDAWLIGGA